MTGRVRWRQALAALLGAVSVAAGLVGAVQATGHDAPTAAVEPVPTRGPGLPGTSDPEAPAPPAGATARPPVFAPSAVVPRPVPPVAAPPPSTAEDGAPRRLPRGSDDRRVDDPEPDAGEAGEAGRTPSSGETQFEWGCRRGYITDGC